MMDLLKRESKLVDKCSYPLTGLGCHREEPYATGAVNILIAANIVKQREQT